MRRLSLLKIAAVPLAAALLGSGCSDSTGPGAASPWGILTPAPAPPVASSPAGALRLLEWCWSRLDTTAYHEVFSDDFRFVCGALDPYGNAYRSTPWTREDELASFTHLARAATNASVAFDRGFRVTDDPRFPGVGRWHKLIRTSATVRVVIADGSEFDCAGYANFFLVRGDSAAIPADLTGAGARPDSTRWYVERWEDETFDGGGARVMPTRKSTWCSIKVLYR